MRERVVGVSVEDDGEVVDGSARELIVVAVDGGGSESVTAGELGVTFVTCVSHLEGCMRRASVGREGKEGAALVLSDRSCLVLRGCGMAGLKAPPRTG